MAVAPPPRQVTPMRWFGLTIILGFAGSLIAVAAFARGTYAIGPLVVELSVRPAAHGTTDLSVEPISGVNSGHAQARTHKGFLAVRGTVVDVRGVATVGEALIHMKDPQTLASFIKDDGKDAGRRFALRVGLMALAGGASGGAVIGLIGLRPRRLFQGAIAGLLLVGVLGFVAYQTYDAGAFGNATFKPAVPKLLLPSP